MIWATASWGQPSVLHLRNGDRVTGLITGEDTNRVVMITPWGNQLLVPIKEIERREAAPAEAAIVLPSPRPATNVVAQARPPAAAPAPSATKPKPTKHWAGDAQVGVDLGFGAKDRQLYSGRFKVTYVQNRFRNIFDYLFSYGKTEGILSANRMEGSSKTDFDVGSRFYVYNLAAAGYDEVRKIDLRYEVGPGVGYHALQLTNFVLNTEVGINYQAQEFSDGTDSHLFFYRLGEDFTWKINDKLTLDEKFAFLPRVEDVQEHRFRFEANLRYALRNNLYLTFTVLDEYDSLPAEGVEKNDLQIRSSIGVKF
jgi:putative salt-induced outer membrane protein YdiY